MNELEEYSAQFVKQLRNSSANISPSLSATEMREILKSSQSGYQGDRVSDVISIDEVIPSSVGGIPCRIYTPPGAYDESTVALYIHGGGWFSGDLETHEPTVKMLTELAGIEIVSVDYSRAPEVKFPEPVFECLTAVEWAQNRWQCPISLIGDSSGGNLVAATCLLSRDHVGSAISRQVLLCPLLDPGNNEYPSRKKYGNGDFVLSEDELRLMIDFYAVNTKDILDPLFSPIKASSFAGLPPALVITAECDMLENEGKAYVDKLRQAGIAADYKMFGRTVHGFPTFGDAIPMSRDALSLAAKFLSAGVCRNKD